MLFHYAAFIVVGYEYHDDFVETGRYSVTLIDDGTGSLWNFANAERELLDLFLDHEDEWPHSHWIRIESIERVELS